MTFFDTHYNKTIAVVDLDGQSVDIHPLDQSLVDEYLGGAALNTALLETYKDDNPIIFGTGPLTGSFAPASCLLAATFPTPQGRISTIPLTLRTGPQLKFAGIDFLVLTNRAAQPLVLCVTEGKLTLHPAKTVEQPGLSDMLEQARRNLGPFESWIITAPAAASGTSVSISRGGSFDKRGLAAAMAGKNLQGIFINAHSGLPFGTRDLARSNALIVDLKSGLSKRERGFASILAHIAPDTVRSLVAGYDSRNIACFRCPVPCMSHVTLPEAMTGAKDRAGFFLADHVGFTALARHAGTAAFSLMVSCSEARVDPLAVADVLAVGGTPEQAKAYIEALSQGNGQYTAAGADDFFGPLEDRDFFGAGLPPLYVHNGESNSESLTAWKTRTARALILGVCPILTARFPALDRALPSFLAAGPDHMAALDGKLTDLAEMIRGRT